MPDQRTITLGSLLAILSLLYGIGSRALAIRDDWMELQRRVNQLERRAKYLHGAPTRDELVAEDQTEATR